MSTYARMSKYDLMQGNEPNTLEVCEHCLMAIESREGHQPILNIIDYSFIDEEEKEYFKCDWCGETELCTLYEI